MAYIARSLAHACSATSQLQRGIGPSRCGLNSLTRTRVIRGCHVVWQNDFFGPLPCILAAFCADAVSDTACQQMLEAACTNSAPREDWSGGPHVECPPQCRCGTEAVSTARMELRLWHASWQCANQATLCATDFNNAFGWHVRCRLSNPGLLGDWAVPLPCT